jgi:hypothetical protein
MSRGWVDALVRAGAVRASYAPDRPGRTDLEEWVPARLVEDAAVTAHPVAEVVPLAPPVASFLDGIQHWRVVGYCGVVPVVRAFVAAAVRRRGAGRRLHTTHEAQLELVLTWPDRLSAAQRHALDDSGLEIVDLGPDEPGQPVRALEVVRLGVEAARVRLEKRVGDGWAAAGGSDEWIVADGVLSEHPALAGHPRAIGVIKSHGAQYFDGADLERALTLAPGYRTSVFQPARRGARHDVYSWYLRLWPWEGRDIHYGLLRVEVRAVPETIAMASAVSAWLRRERAPVSAPDARWDRLLYPIHDVESYLLSRVPRDLLVAPGPRLPSTGT